MPASLCSVVSLVTSSFLRPKERPWKKLKLILWEVHLWKARAQSYKSYNLSFNSQELPYGKKILNLFLYNIVSYIYFYILLHIFYDKFLIGERTHFCKKLYCTCIADRRFYYFENCFENENTNLQKMQVSVKHRHFSTLGLSINDGTQMDVTSFMDNPLTRVVSNTFVWGKLSWQILWMLWYKKTGDKLPTTPCFEKMIQLLSFYISYNRNIVYTHYTCISNVIRSCFFKLHLKASFFQPIWNVIIFFQEHWPF